MSREFEIEKTYLAKYLPADLRDHKYLELLDIYLPENSPHPKLRIRKSGDSYTITKKSPVSTETCSIQNEDSIKITAEEFNALLNVSARKIHKIRYLYPYQEYIAEFDVFLDQLAGLVLIDFEFASQESLEQFKMPDFCLADVTETKDIAGGVLSGHDLQSLKNIFNKFSYQEI
ncbi:MAG: hypothetical protein ACOYMB_05455 [Patescibacteria group bacterium]